MLWDLVFDRWTRYFMGENASLSRDASEQLLLQNLYLRTRDEENETCDILGQVSGIVTITGAYRGSTPPQLDIFGLIA